MSTFNFEKQLQIEDKYTPLILRYLSASLGEQALDMRNQCLEYDFSCAGKKFDLKADQVISSSSNFFLERASIVKKGWLYNANVDVILYLDVNNQHLHILDLKELQKHESEIKQWPQKWIHQDANYETIGHCVPFSKVNQWLKFKTVSLKSISLADFTVGGNTS